MHIVDDPNDLTKRPADAVLISPTEDGRWRVYCKDDEDIPAWFKEAANPAPEEPAGMWETLKSWVGL
jgi:hypothetical protein